MPADGGGHWRCAAPPALHRSWTVPVLLGGHFLSAFAMLGMPPFLPTLLDGFRGAHPAWLPGALFALPTVATALAAPVWGRLADRWGRRLSLRRAYAGLAAGFALAAIAPTLPWFVLALLLQGASGGAMAATNAYLSTRLDRTALRQALNWTQMSARTAMVCAPALLGMLFDRGAGQRVYGWMVVLPLLALAASFVLPPDGDAGPTTPHVPVPARRAGRERMHAVLAVQALFSAAAVATFPYFVPFASRLGWTGSWRCGAIYALPHLVVLLGLPLLRRAGARPTLAPGLLLLAATSLGHAVLPLVPVAAPVLLLPLRLLMGAAMLLGFNGLHAAVARALDPARAGLAFSRFDAAAKWAGAIAGLCAGLLVSRFGLAAPFLLSTVAAALALPVARRLFQPIGSPA